MGKVRFPGTNVGSSSCLKYLVMSATRSLLNASRKRELLPTRLESAGATLPGSDLSSSQQTTQLQRTFAEEEMEREEVGWTKRRGRRGDNVGMDTSMYSRHT